MPLGRVEKRASPWIQTVMVCVQGEVLCQSRGDCLHSDIDAESVARHLPVNIILNRVV